MVRLFQIFLAAKRQALQERFSYVREHTFEKFFLWRTRLAQYRWFAPIIERIDVMEREKPEGLIYVPSIHLTESLLETFVMQTSEPITTSITAVIDDTIANETVKVSQDILSIRTRKGHVQTQVITGYAHNIGLGNDINANNVAQVVNTAIFRVGDRKSKPIGLSPEAIDLADRIVTNAIEKVIDPDRICEQQIFGEVFQKLMDDSQLRHYPERYEGAPVETSFDWNQIRFTVKSDLKPANYTKGFKLSSVGQGVASAHIAVTTSFIFVERLIAAVLDRMYRKDEQVYVMSPNGQSREEFLTEMTTELRRLSFIGGRPSLGDVVKMDKEMKEIEAYMVSSFLNRVTGIPWSYLQQYDDYTFQGAFKGKNVAVTAAHQNPSGCTRTERMNRIVTMLYHLWCVSVSGPRVIVGQGDDITDMCIEPVFSLARWNECKKYTQIDLYYVAPDANAFCGFVWSEGLLTLDIYRMLIRATSRKSKDYESFREYQMALRDAITLIRKIGVKETVGVQAMYLRDSQDVPLLYDECKNIFDCLCSWAYASRADWHRHVKYFSYSYPIANLRDGRFILDSEFSFLP